MRKLSIILFTFIITSAVAQVRDFTMTDTKGNTRNLFTELDAGKVVVIDFFSTTCGSCQLGIPEMESVWIDVLDRGDLGYVWAVEAMHRTDSAIDVFFENYGGTFPAFSIIDDDSVVNDTFGYHVPYTPYYYVISPQYKIHNVSLDNVRKFVEDALGINSIVSNSISQIRVRRGGDELFVSNIPVDEHFNKVILHDMSGRKIVESPLENGAQSIIINSDFNSGIYILTLVSVDQKVLTVKVAL